MLARRVPSINKRRMELVLTRPSYSRPVLVPIKLREVSCADRVARAVLRMSSWASMDRSDRERKAGSEVDSGRTRALKGGEQEHEVMASEMRVGIHHVDPGGDDSSRKSTLTR